MYSGVVEVWKDVPRCPEQEVSNLGRLRRTIDSDNQFKAGRIYQLRPDNHGYMRTNVRNIDGKIIRLSVHVAVLEAFVGPRPYRHDASHINGIQTDNRLENLAWETSSANHQRKLDHGTLIHGEKHKCAKLTADQVRQIRSRKSEPCKLLAAEYGVSGTLIYRIKSGLAWPHAA